MKKYLGQFYTTNYNYIFSNFNIPKNVIIVEPFVGNGDLLKFCSDYRVECYDIEPKNETTIQRNTLLHPPIYTNRFVLTNPPYLASNKNTNDTNKKCYELYKTDDLYKCFLYSIIRNVCLGGIVIIPLNFWCSMRKQDIQLRKDFLDVYEILCLNVFKKQVFDDTTYNVCSFQFQQKTSLTTSIPLYLYPENKCINIQLYPLNCMIGGEIYHLPQSKNIKVFRLTKNNINHSCITDILVSCLDKSENERLCMSINENHFVDNTPNLTARSMATLIIEPKLTTIQQTELVNRFNFYLNSQRDKYDSLFLTNYRDKSRKRISFQLVYEIVNYLLSNDETNL